MTPTVDPELLARFLRQRQELGAEELFFEGVSRAEILSGLQQEQRAAASPVASPAREKAVSRPSKPATGRPQPSSGPSETTAGPAQPPAGQKTNAELEVLDYPGLESVANACGRCGLAATRNHVVFSDGNPDARLMVVGEAPGANEDATGVPFVGQAGKMLDLLLAAVDLSRQDSVYICNVLDRKSVV